MNDLESLKEERKVIDDKIKALEDLNDLPMSFEALKIVNGSIVDGTSGVSPATTHPAHVTNSDVWIDEEHALASVALRRLLHLRKAWIKNWIANWLIDDTKYVIVVNAKGQPLALATSPQSVSFVLSFPSRLMADRFLEAFEADIMIARPLL